MPASGRAAITARVDIAERPVAHGKQFSYGMRNAACHSCAANAESVLKG